MGHIRPFAEPDIPLVAALHRAVFRTSHDLQRDGYPAYFRSVYLDNPSRDSGLPSLVYEANDRIVGFLGVVPRRLRMGGKRLQAAVSSQFIVDANGRSGVVAVQLARTFLEGPQDLSIADEANDAARRLWEGLGGTTALLPSLHWTRPLRPARLALSFLRNRTALAPLAAIAGPPSRILDALATRLPHSQLFQSRPHVLDGDLRADTVVAHLAECTAGSVTVEYDRGTLQWLLVRAAARTTGSRLHTAAIMNSDANVIGWYVYSLERGGIAEVLQLAAKPCSIEPVLDHLFYRAWRQGAVAVAGRLEPRLLQALSDKYCLFHRRGPWMLVHARRPDIVRAFQLGDVFFSRLDGEWCLRY